MFTFKVWYREDYKQNSDIINTNSDIINTNSDIINTNSDIINTGFLEWNLRNLRNLYWEHSRGSTKFQNQNLRKIRVRTYKETDREKNNRLPYTLYGYKSSELKTLEWYFLNPDYLIWVSDGHGFDFLLKPFFLGYSRENQKPVFLNYRVPPISVYNLKWRASFKFIDFVYATLIDWIFMMIRLVSILWKKRGSLINPNINYSKVFSSD